MCRDKVDAATVGDGRRQRLDLVGPGNHAEPIAQPLNDGTAHEDAAFEEIGRLLAQPPADRRQHAVARVHRLAAGVQQQEAARAIGVLRHAVGEAGLAKSRRLLVAGDAGERYLGAEEVAGDRRDDATAVDDLRQHCRRDVEQGEKLFIPAAAANVEEQGT